jgi:hypothetical protein
MASLLPGPIRDGRSRGRSSPGSRRSSLRVLALLLPLLFLGLALVLTLLFLRRRRRRHKRVLQLALHPSAPDGLTQRITLLPYVEQQVGVLELKRGVRAKGGDKGVVHRVPASAVEGENASGVVAGVGTRAGVEDKGVKAVASSMLH